MKGGVFGGTLLAVNHLSKLNEWLRHTHSPEKPVGNQTFITSPARRPKPAPATNTGKNTPAASSLTDQVGWLLEIQLMLSKKGTMVGANSGKRLQLVQEQQGKHTCAEL